VSENVCHVSFHRGFEQVVEGADHRPLGCDLVEAAQMELAEASGMFDLAEHGLDDLLSQAVAAAPADALAHGRGETGGG